MSEMALIIPVIVVTLFMAVGTVVVVGRLVRQREQMSPVREVPEVVVPEAAYDEDFPLAA